MFLFADVTCAGLPVGTTFSSQVPYIINLIITIIKIAVPVLLIIFGMLDLGKAVMAQKDDEIKKAEQTFIKRILSAVLVFFVIAIVQLIFKLVDPDDGGVWDCVSCFVNGPTERAQNSGGNCRK